MKNDKVVLNCVAQILFKKFNDDDIGLKDKLLITLFREAIKANISIRLSTELNISFFYFYAFGKVNRCCQKVLQKTC